VLRLVRIFALAVIIPALLQAGCGNSRTPVPSLTRPAAPDGFRRVAYPQAGIQFEVPRDWAVAAERAPLIATVSSGPATVAVWRYIRPKPPDSAGVTAQLGAARAALIAAAEARAPTLRVIRARTVTLADLPTVVLDATERVAGNPRRVRSIHMFAPGLEIVIEEYAPPTLFHTVDRAVFSPLKRSLALIWAPQT
jgi:hypothetical protein